MEVIIISPTVFNVEIDLLFSKGISKELDLLDAAVHFKVIVQSGSWFAFGDAKIAQGRDQVLQYLRAPEVFEKVHKKVFEAIAAEESSLISLVPADLSKEDAMELE